VRSRGKSEKSVSQSHVCDHLRGERGWKIEERGKQNTTARQRPPKMFIDNRPKESEGKGGGKRAYALEANGSFWPDAKQGGERGRGGGRGKKGTGRKTVVKQVQGGWLVQNVSN